MNRLTRSHSKLLKISTQEFSSSPYPRILSPKYLRRTLIFDPENCKNLKKLVAKRIHIKKIIEVEKEDEEDDCELAEKRCFKKGLFKSLTHIKFFFLFHNYWLEDWKSSKRVVRFDYRYHGASHHEIILRYFRYFERINKNIEEIDFAPAFLGITSLDFKRLYKRIRRFRKLKTFRCKNTDNNEKDFIKKEFLSQVRYLQRLPCLRRFACYLPDEGQLSLRELMNENKAYLLVTKLYVNLEYLTAFREDIPNVTTEIHPFFNFQVFPNLKEFTLKADIDPKEFLGSFSDFVVKGFQQLQLLQNLFLKFTCHLPGIKFLFQGLLELPQLSTISLSIHAPHDAENWETLIAFTKKQTSFVSFKLCLRAFNEFSLAGFIKGKNGDRLLEEFFASLSHKPKLQYLVLNADCWQLEPLSQGLKRLIDTPQLKSLDLRTTNQYSVRYLVSPSEKYPFEGLCEFLLRNKETLDDLKLDIPILRRQKSNKALNESICQLGQIKSLWLQILTAPLKRDKNCPKKYLDIKLDSLLPSLKKLQELKLNFEDVQEWSEEHRKWMGKSLKILPSLKNLKSFEFLIPAHKLFEAEAETINLALRDLKQVVHLNFLDCEEKYNLSPYFKTVERNVKNLAAQRHLNINLSF